MWEMINDYILLIAGAILAGLGFVGKKFWNWLSRMNDRSHQNKRDVKEIKDDITESKESVKECIKNSEVRIMKRIDETKETLSGEHAEAVERIEKLEEESESHGKDLAVIKNDLQWIRKKLEEKD